jgi:hypothetical protein
LIGARDAVVRDSVSTADADAAKYELRAGIGADLGPAKRRQLNGGAAAGLLIGLCVEIFFGLSRIESRLVRLLREGLWNSRKS